MKGRSYNSVGAGATPKLGKCSSIFKESRPGGPQSAGSVKVSTDIPKVARPKSVPASSPQPPKVARPGGAQGV